MVCLQRSIASQFGQAIIIIIIIFFVVVVVGVTFARGQLIS